ncbi:MAG: hypothetical protein FWC91_11285 [Defluviitaleaceae bacterium]|nr:hypothetical protein [Defluviitaleaceae bacterium]
MNIIVGVLLIIALVGVFIGTYLLNKRIPVPDDVDIRAAACHGCTITSCHNHSKYNKDSEGA